MSPNTAVTRAGTARPWKAGLSLAPGSILRPVLLAPTCSRGWEGTRVHRCCDNQRSTGEREKNKIGRNTQKTPYKTKSLENCEPFDLFLYNKRQKASLPSLFQSCQKCQPNPCAIFENFTLQGYSKWLWWQQKPTKKQETRWLLETLMATCRQPSTATAWWQPGSLQRHNLQSPALTLILPVLLSG